MKRKASAGTEARRRVDRLRALRNDPVALREHARTILADEGSPDILKLALESLGENIALSDRETLVSLYSYFQEAGPKRDPTGPLRVAILQALWHLRSRDDIELARRATNLVEPGLNGNGEMIRAAGLSLLAALDPDDASYAAVRMLGRGDAAEFNGEPSATAVRVLSSLGDTRTVLLIALRGGVRPDVQTEAIRSLASVPPEHLREIFERADATDDEGTLVAMADLALQLPASPEVSDLVARLLDSAPRGELFEFLASSIVASRRQELIAVLLAALPTEMSQKRLRAACDALQFAPKTAEVEVAVAELERRLAKQAPPAKA